ncbi:MAG: (Fe-S)-binding protein [Promethearchaeota archaeon]|nr:MAG: (Fe-S)-binding protein [Candidatus Lokiarchaeota archaeon]
MSKTKRVSGFREDLCNLCGICLHKCPVLRLPIDEAKKEMQNLIEGRDAKHVLYACTTCFSCNLYCPQQANPYQLILERWNDLYRKRGAPPLYRFVVPTMDSNIWQMLNIFLSNRERRWIYKWMHTIPKPGDVPLLVGNYTHLFPFIIGGSKILNHFTPVDRIDQWEGGAYLYQGGYLDVVKKISESTKQDFNSWGVDKVAATLDAVEYIFKNVHPNEMGVIHNQNFINFNQWLLESIKSNSIQIEQKLNLLVTVHDNCYSKASNGAYWDPPREILALCGCKIVEMKHNRKDSLCCGFGAGASWKKNISIVFDIISEGMKKFKEAEETGAEALITYCGGCLYLLWATKELLRSKIKLYHIIEICRIAMGEKLNFPGKNVDRAWDIIAIITYSLLLSFFRKNFHINQIKYDKEMSTFKPKKFRILRIIRYAMNLPMMKFIFAHIFQLLRVILKSK